MKFIDAVVWITVGAVIGLIITGYWHNNRLDKLEVTSAYLYKKVHQLQRETIYLDTQIGSNKLLLKETQRLVVPDELALKEVIK